MFAPTLLSSLVAIAGVSSVLAHPAPVDWYHEPDSDIAALFVKRAPNPNDPNFASNYPAGWVTPPASSLPKAWTDKLASIQMPNVQPSNPNNGYPTYQGGESPADSTICSFTYQCSEPDDLVTPPTGILALSFDDGPTSSSPTLYDFLAKNNVAGNTTHFMIGGNILGSPTTMQAAASAGGHIAVHTWSHPYMTTLSNEDVLGELGWTMQIISDLNGGRVPKFWRPPFGDVDNRVRAIAKGVFGLSTVPWDNDSADWAISTGQYTKQSVEDSINGWLQGNKTPGLNILEHELNDNTVGVFMDIFPNIAKNGWTIKSVADAWDMAWYQNSPSNTGPVVSMAIADAAPSGSASATSASPSSVSSSAPSASSASASGSSASSASSGRSSQVASAAAAAASPSKSSGAGSLTAAGSGLLLSLAVVVSAAFA